jgi:cytochrome d ubiquinol oxidase subunit II
VATGAYLAAVFLVSDARRAGAPDLERYFATRALVAAVVTGRSQRPGSSACTAMPVHLRRPHWRRLPLVIVSLLCGIAVLVLLRRGARRGARPLAIGAVAAVIWAGASPSGPTSCRRS